MREGASNRRPAFVVVSIVGQKGATNWIVNPVYVIDAADVASSDEAVDRAMRQFADEWPDYKIVTSTKELVGQANPPKIGGREDEKNTARRPRGRQLEESHGES